MGRILEVMLRPVHVQRSAVWRALCRSKILYKQSLIWCAPSWCKIRLLFPLLMLTLSPDLQTPLVSQIVDGLRGLIVG